MTDLSNIIPVNIEEEVSHSYIDYAMSVIIGRALPDVRDGLKPVHRRILYAMHEQSNTFNRPYKKSARIVGDVMGKYHPHGDSSIYDALVRMAQDFSMRLPLVDGQGNFGSIDGDPAAAMRYTEVRMTRATNNILSDLDKETVDFGPNYDDTETEPLVLPTQIPTLLVNGSEGIAVGMATRIPPHNLGEVIDAVIHLINNPEADLDALMQFVKGPDFPTYGTIYGLQGIRDAYEHGRGIVYIRAEATVETDEKTDSQRIIVSELPFQVNKARLIEKIAELVRDKRIEGIRDLRDESDRRGMRVVIELKRDVIGEIILNQLFKMTQLQTSFGIILLAIVAGRPELLSLKRTLSLFIDFRRDVVSRRCRFELRKAQNREHILLGLQIALDNIDAVIALIRASKNVEEARSGLCESFGLSKTQAQAILEMRLQKLTGLEREKVLAELKEIQETIARLKGVLADESLLLQVIIDELLEIRELHAENRRTNVLAGGAELTIEDLVAEEDWAVTVSHQGYIKRTALSIYRAQRRGGVGRTGMSTKDDDFLESVFVASTHTKLLVFTTRGRVFKLTVYQLPPGGPNTRGRPIVNLLDMEEDERPAYVLPMSAQAENEFIIMATEKGTIKRSRLDSYDNIYSRGIIAIKLRDGDRLIRVRLCNEEDRIIMASQGGKSIQFPVAQVSPTGRATMGVRGMSLKVEDCCVGMEVIRDPELTILSVTRNGYGKRTRLEDYRYQKRGGQGVITIKTTDRNGPVVSVRQVKECDELVMVTNLGKLIRTNIKDINVIGRNTQGVRLMRTEKKEWVAGVALLAESVEEEVLSEDLEEGSVQASSEEPDVILSSEKTSEPLADETPEEE
jgi:DNA gyrase subunit A